MQLNHTHDINARSWVASACVAGTDFPIQNLPFCAFRKARSAEPFRGGVAIGDQVLDLAALARTGLLQGVAAQAAQACSQPALNAFLEMGKDAWRGLRHALFDLLLEGRDAHSRDTVSPCLAAQADVEFDVPVRVQEFTDFYTSIYHARNVGGLVSPDAPVTSNFEWLPIAYHARASSIRVSGTPFHRPMGQQLIPGSSTPVYAPCARLDYELEIGAWIGTGNTWGKPISVSDAESHIFGIGLLNDWSARDIQFWEMAPLGPFLGKNFATTVSPWIVTLEALAPYRQAWRTPQVPPLPYLDASSVRQAGALDIGLEVLLETAQHRELGKEPVRLARTSFKHQYWTVEQMVAQHTVGGCNFRSGDLLGSGTISGPTPQECGAIIELTQGGTHPFAWREEDGTPQQRSFLLDGDAVIFRGWCEAPGHARIGFGECRAEVLPALTGAAG